MRQAFGGAAADEEAARAGVHVDRTVGTGEHPDIDVFGDVAEQPVALVLQRGRRLTEGGRPRDLGI